MVCSVHMIVHVYIRVEIIKVLMLRYALALHCAAEDTLTAWIVYITLNIRCITVCTQCKSTFPFPTVTEGFGIIIMAYLRASITLEIMNLAGINFAKSCNYVLVLFI